MRYVYMYPNDWIKTLLKKLTKIKKSRTKIANERFSKSQEKLNFQIHVKQIYHLFKIHIIYLAWNLPQNFYFQYFATIFFFSLTLPPCFEKIRRSLRIICLD